MFSQASVILLTGGVSQHALGHKSPRQTPPPPGQKHPPGRHPWADIPRQTPTPGRYPPPQRPLLRTVPIPTGMHPCYLRFQFMLPRSEDQEEYPVVREPNIIFTASQRSCGEGNVFTGVSVIVWGAALDLTVQPPTRPCSPC